MNKLLLTAIPITGFLLSVVTKISLAQKENSNENTPTEMVQSAIYQTKEKYCRDTFLVRIIGKHHSSVNGKIVHELEEYFSLYPLGWSSENPSLDFRNLKFHWHYKLVNESKRVLNVPYFGGMATVTRYFQTNLHSSIISQHRYTSSFNISRDFLTDFSSYSYILKDIFKTGGDEIIVIDYQPIQSRSKWYGRFHINKNKNFIIKCDGIATGKDMNDDTITESFSCEYTVNKGVIYPKKGYMTYRLVKNKPAEDETLFERVEFYHAWEVMDITQIDKKNVQLLNVCNDFQDEYDKDKKDIKIAEYFNNNEDFKKRALYYHGIFEKLKSYDK